MWGEKLANEVIDRYGVEISASTSQYNQSIDAAIAKTKAFQTQQNKLIQDIDKNRQQQEKTASSLEKAASKYGENSDQAKKLSSKLQDLRSKEQALGSQLSSVNKALDQQTSALSETSNSAQKAEQGLEGVSTKMSSLNRLMTGILTAQAGKSFLEATIGSLAQFEQYETSFAVMLGDMGKAKTMLEDLQNFAAKTPFEMTDIVPNAQLLMNYGVAAEDLIQTMTRLGDLSQGQAEKLDRISLAYGQMLAKGKVTNEELLQLTEAGAPVMQELAKNLQVSTAELQDMVSNGVVGVDDLNAAIESLTTGTGKFAGMMQAQSETLIGQWSTLKDEVGQIARDIGEESFDTLKNSLSEVSDELDRMRESGELDQMAQEWGAVFGKITEGVMGTTTAMVKNKEIVGLLVTAYGALKIVQQVSAMMTAYRTAVQAGTTAQAAFNTVAAANPYALLASGLSLAIGSVILFTNETSAATEKIEELDQKIRNLNSDQIETAADRIAELTIAEQAVQDIQSLYEQFLETGQGADQLASAVDTLNQTLGYEAAAFDSSTGSLDMNTQAIYRNIAAMKARALQQAAEEELVSAAKQKMQAEKQIDELNESLDRAERLNESAKKSYENINGWNPLNWVNKGLAWESAYGIDGTQKKVDDLNKQIQEQQQIADKAGQYMDDLTDKISKYAEESQKASQEVKDSWNASNTSGVTGGGTSGTSGGTSKTASVKKQAEKEAKTWQESYYEELQYLRNMDEISEQDYINGLIKIRDSYRESDLEKYRKYNLEIYQIQQQLIEETKRQQEEVEKTVRESFDKQLQIAEEYLNERKQQISDEYDAAVKSVNDRYDAMAESARADYEAEKERVDKIIEQIDREIEARRNAREEEKLEDELSLAEKQVQNLQTRISYARTPEERAELEKELKRQQEELKDLTTEKEIRDLEAQREIHEDKLEKLEEQYEAESEYIEQRRQEELEALEAARDKTLEMLETTFQTFESQLYSTYGYVNEETVAIGKRFADATTQTLDAGFQTVAANAQAVIDSMIADVHRAIEDMESAISNVGERAQGYYGSSRTTYNSADNRSASIVNHNYNGMTAGQVNAMMNRQVERVLYGRR